MLRLAKRTWVLLVIVLVVFIAAFCVDRFRGFFGHTVLTKPGAGLVNDPAPFNPKVGKYEIFGDGARAWRGSLTLTTTAPAASPNIIAQSDGDAIPCRVTVDGVVKDERTSDGVNAQTFCLVKSA